jgi:hypothetical protein
VTSFQPGWHPDPDPSNPGGQRYWDGTQWTGHSQPGQVPDDGPPAGSQPGSRPGGQPASNRPPGWLVGGTLGVVLGLIAGAGIGYAAKKTDHKTDSAGPSVVTTVVVTTTAPPGTSTPTDTSNPPATPTPTATATSGNLKFGQTAVFDDGLKAVVSPPSPYTPSDTASADKAFTQFVVFTITVTNGSAQNYKPLLFDTSVQSGSKEGDQVFDSANDINLPPSTALLPGRSVNWRVVFGVSNPKDIVLEITPGYDYKSAVYTT